MDRTTPVFLVGPMGSGKSAVGHRLAALMQRDFIDTDREIEERCGVDISFIFEKEGEAGFRKREHDALARAAKLDGVVIATGGGIITQPRNVDLLRDAGLVVYLETSPEQQYSRTRHTNSRPLLEDSDPQQKLYDLMSVREPIYKSIANIVVNTDGQRVPQVAKKVLHHINIYQEPEPLTMQTLNVNLGARSYPICIGQSLIADDAFWREIRQHVQLPESVFIVSDQNVAPHYLQQLCLGLGIDTPQHIILPPGESQKTLTTVSNVLDQLVETGLQRDGAVIALGGGVVGDMAGFAAACYMRGIGFIQIPTTVLAQVDSSVGGKTGVNHALGKNLIGAFYQPQLVVIDTDTLQTLDAREVRAGIAEIIKYGCIVDGEFFTWLESNMARLLKLDSDALAYAIKQSCAAKAKIVAKDELEKGERALLNFGHSFGHALEQVTHYEKWLHGEAVAIGMLMASRLSQLMGLISSEQEQRIGRLIAAAELPQNAGPLEINALIQAMQKDKKNTATERRLVVLTDVGASEVRSDCPSDLVQTALRDYCQQ